VERERWRGKRGVGREDGLGESRRMGGEGGGECHLAHFSYLAEPGHEARYTRTTCTSTTSRP